MFDTLKNLNNLRKQAAELQKQLEAEKITGNSADGLVSITINGNHDLIDFRINSESNEINKDQVTTAIKDAYNKTASELKSTLARKFQGML